MSATVVLMPIVAPIVWPVMVSATTAVMVSLGFAAVKAGDEIENEEVDAKTSVELDIPNSTEVGQNLSREEKLVFEKDGVTVIFTRDVRGKVKVCVEGEGYTKAELEEFGRELAGRVIQRFAYDRIVAEMQQKSGMSMVEQSVDENDTIHIKLRSWED